MKHFQKAYLRPFPGLNVFAFIVVNIQPNSKFHSPPPKLSVSASGQHCSKIIFFIQICARILDWFCNKASFL